MTSVKGAKIDDSGQAPNSGSTTLHGRIEAIGIHDLLRVSTGKASTGRLLVFNDTSDAEIYYEQGRLVAVVSGASFGAECLQQVLLMQEGEFEFAVGLQATAERKTPNLHEAMIASIREHYEVQVRNRQAAVRASGEEARSSGVHKIDGQEAAAAQPAAAPGRSPAPSRAAAPRPAGTQTSAPAPAAPPARTSAAQAGTGPSNAAPRPSPAPANPASTDEATRPATGAKVQLLPGELGSAVIDPSGRVLQRLGSLTQHEAALAALGLKLAVRLGVSLGAREPLGLELHAVGEKALFCIAAAEGIRISKISPDADTDSVWKQLKT